MTLGIEKRIGSDFLVDPSTVKPLVTGKMVQFRTEKDGIYLAPPLIVLQNNNEIHLIFAKESRGGAPSFQSSKDFIKTFFIKNSIQEGYLGGISPDIPLSNFLQRIYYIAKNTGQLNDAGKDEYLEKKDWVKEYTQYLAMRRDNILSSKHTSKNSRKKGVKIDYDILLKQIYDEQPIVTLRLPSDCMEFEIFLITKPRGQTSFRQKRVSAHSKHQQNITMNQEVIRVLSAQAINETRWDKFIVYILYMGYIIPVPAIYLKPSELI